MPNSRLFNTHVSVHEEQGGGGQTEGWLRLLRFKVKNLKKVILAVFYAVLKDQLTPKSKTHIFTLACSAIYPSGLFWCELPSVEDINRRDVFLLSNIMELDGIQFVVLKAPKEYI